MSPELKVGLTVASALDIVLFASLGPWFINRLALWILHLTSSSFQSFFVCLRSKILIQSFDQKTLQVNKALSIPHHSDYSFSPNPFLTTRLCSHLTSPLKFHSGGKLLLHEQIQWVFLAFNLGELMHWLPPLPTSVSPLLGSVITFSPLSFYFWTFFLPLLRWTMSSVSCSSSLKSYSLDLPNCPK